MTRAAKANNSIRSIATARKPGRSPATTVVKPTEAKNSSALKRSIAAPTEKRKPGRPAKAPDAPLPKATRAMKVATRTPSVPSAPKISKDELRAQVEKLEGLVVTLRAKNRETNKAAKAAMARIAELEAQVAQLGEKVTAHPEPARQLKLTKPARTRRQGREIDPGDAVPPGVAVQEPTPLDEEAENALENLEAHLGHA
jgi:uncharacterized coiled-coil DUF342 family protein